MSRRCRIGLLVVAAGVLMAGCSAGAAGEDDVVRVYSGRHYDLERAFELFSKETGISVEFLFGSDAELRERIDAEGADTQADAYIAVDGGNLHLAAARGLFQPLTSRVLDAAVPENLRDPEGRWFGLSMRARSIVYNPERVRPTDLSTYEDLAHPRWRDRLCMRDPSNVYTQSLVASLIAHHGYDEALRTVRGWVANNVDILSSDVLIVETIAEGGCDVGIVNHYYLARLLEEEPDLQVELYWANQEERGVHVNVSGGGVTAHADDPDLARRLIEWLATDGQRAFVEGNHEYPVNGEVSPDPLIEEIFGTDFKVDRLNAGDYGSLNSDAIRLLDEAGYG